MDKVKVGVIGTSYWADLMHLPSVKSHEQADLVAICGRNQERAAERADKYGIREQYADYRRMLDQADLDAVVIVTPDDVHYPMVMAALERGLHVMCEKPLALNATQAAEMLQAAEKARVKHMVFFTNRWRPYLRYYRRLLTEGTVGRCLYFRFRFLKPVNLKADRGYRWRDDGKRGHGVLGDLGSHMIDLCRHCVDEIRSVSASLAVHVPSIGPGHPTQPANDSALLMVETRQGSQGILHASHVAAISDAGLYLTVHGERGVLELTLAYTATGERISLVRPGEPPCEMPLPEDLASEFAADKPYIPQLLQLFAEQPVGDRQFIDAILGAARAEPSFYDGYKVMQVIDAAVESAETGRRIAIPDD
jgi:predicted dehydrogenase